MYELLSAAHATTTVGLLLGLAAGRRGSGDSAVHKALALHAPALVRAAAPGAAASMLDLEIPTVVQACALVGLGLLHQGSYRRGLVDFLAAEIGGSPVSERGEQRESYCAAAGAALGLVMLAGGGGYSYSGTGRNAAPPSHHDAATAAASTRVDDELLRYVFGGRRKDTGAAFFDPTRPDLLREGPLINTTVTAPGGALALALRFLRTGDASVAAALAPPTTPAALASLRPDVLQSCVIARAMVLWHELDALDADRHFDLDAATAEAADAAAARGEPGAAPPWAGPASARAAWEARRRATIAAWTTAQVPAYVRRVARRLAAAAEAAAAAVSATAPPPPPLPWL